MTHREIINSLLDKNIAILAGAGISRNSGLPVVNDFYKKFLPIFYDTDDVEYLISLIHNGGIPFERMMEHIFNYTGNDYSVMNIFDNGEPNTLHNILAQTMYSGWADELYTTNFDCLIEQAIENKGLVTKNYGVFYDEKGFTKLSKSTYDKKVIKIHGTVKEKDSIRTTLKTIASQKQLIKRKPPIERLFSTGHHEIVLVLGYSFSDIFDVNKFIDKLNANKTIIVVNYKNGQQEDNNPQLLADVSTFGESKNPFYNKKCNGYVVNIDTLIFMSELCVAKYGSVPITNPIEYDWENYLDNWSVQYVNNDMRKAYIAGGICNSMNEFALSEKYMSNAYKLANTNDLGLYVSIITHYVLSKFRTIKNKQECDGLISLCSNTVELLKNNKANLSNELYLIRLGGLYARMGAIYEKGYLDYKQALSFYYLGYRTEYKRNDILGMSQTLNNIGNAYILLDNLNLALKCLRKSIKFKKKCGYVGGITRTYYNMAQGIFKVNRKKIRQAEYYLKKANDSVKNVGETELVFYIKNMQGTIYTEKRMWNEAEDILKKNVSRLENEPHKTLLTTANYELARCEIRLKKYTDAIERLERNLQLVTDLDFQERIFRNNQELALAYLLQNNPIKCYDHLLNNVNSLTAATNAEKGHYFFYVALYYKKYNLKTYYKQFLYVSKYYFRTNEIVNDFYSLKRDFDKEIIPNKTTKLDEDKYLLRERVEEKNT